MDRFRLAFPNGIISDFGVVSAFLGPLLGAWVGESRWNPLDGDGKRTILTGTARNS
jgi:hypothetical protein